MTETEAAAESQNGNETKTDDTSPENLNKVERQMNYYFGDYNYPRDKFLQQQAQLDDGWIPLEVMLKCARLKALTENASTVLLAIAQSKEGLLEVSEDKKKIRRAQPAPDVNEEAQLATQSRTAYCKGFPLDEKLDNLLEYFKQFGDCETVLMRHYRDKEAKTMKFKGSVFVVFKTDELAKKFMELESVKFNETELIRKWQVDYFEEKKKERMEKIESKKSKPNKPVEREFKEESGNISLPKNSVLKIKDIPGDVTREDIKSALTLACPDVKIAFIEFDKGNPEAFIRLADEGSSPKAIEALGEGGKLVVCGVELVVEALSEEDEKPVLEKAEKFLNSRRMFGSKGRGGFKKGKRRGRGGFHGGKRARND
ncbi:la protein homolog [Neocloeon triangulifer]|uniref:la protein homolog n=1 Tax=Neocloeon triangulifer TaxID=2078957 RepID=UPI00286EDD33|nr:la protein homolog [Neocloeon triangulifer]